jgi:type VI secretion system protein ImpA
LIDFSHLTQALDDGSPCGADCEYDADFLALSQAATGKPEQQFGETVIPAVEPDWRDVDRLAQALFTRTKDLRVGSLLTLANTYLAGVEGYSAGISLLVALCEQYWDEVHPRIEVDGDVDPFMRMNALASLADGDGYGLLRALRASRLVAQPITVTVRDAELTFSKAPEAQYSEPQLLSALGDALNSESSAIAAFLGINEALKRLRAILDEKVSPADQPDLDAIVAVVKSVSGGIDRARGTGEVVDGEDTLDGDNAGTDGLGTSVRGSAGVGLIQSRDDARRALDRVCEYLERHEPSNPASLFARRAQRMLNLNFLDIMRELSPDSMSHLEMLTGAQQDQS